MRRRVLPRKIDAALFIFKGGSATEAIPFGPFNAKAITDWVNGFSSFDTGTPLGNALAQAGDRVLKSNRAHRHVLVITDGMNTLGPDPAVTLPKLKDKAGRQEASLAVHFVAFDVDARVFNPIKKLGATVVSAADEKQLKSQLEFILQRKILLEDEEPAKKN